MGVHIDSIAGPGARAEVREGRSAYLADSLLSLEARVRYEISRRIMK